MSFALHPEDGYPRLVRGIDPALMPEPDVVAVLDREQNLLQVDREKLDRLNKSDRAAVFLTRNSVERVTTNPDGRLVLVRHHRRVPFSRRTNAPTTGVKREKFSTKAPQPTGELHEA